ncbi:23S rRNA (pseudouridine(1915)-N(3))-methyltransferase RlmH [Candidatus Saccharibacteria bacterium]|jgi:23S rRNA (pseudouridine1915-N3)-methyltransferase|nr:23S rRNA (pseudouridine(1915)-N(3))-methyltransferase RlmH [Candidatus Saccharibacteria bacterium]
MIRIIAIGKKHDAWVRDGLQRYYKRLRKPFSVDWVLLPYSTKSYQKARQDESEAILSCIKPGDYVILLDERGKNLSSPEMASYLQEAISSRSVTFVIGGAYGVDDRLRERSDLVWSLSRLVFPHMIVRLMLLEQIYRAQEIARGGPYHHI